MGLCKDCRYWDYVEDHPVQGRYGECQRFEADLAVIDKPEPAWLWAHPDSILMTGALFGCAAFEKSWRIGTRR